MTEMTYVRRDGEGKIDGVDRAPNEGYTEKLPEDDPGVVAFLAGPPEPPSIKEIIEAVDQIAKAVPLTAAKRNKITALMTRVSGA